MRQRDYPRQFYLGDTQWSVKFVRKMPPVAADTKRHRTVGYCCFETSTVYILMGLSPFERLVTFVHELMHAFEAEFDLEIPHKLIEQLEEPFASFWHHNIAS